MLNELTANVDASLERSVNVWVHFNVEVLLLGHSSVTICYLLSEPIIERVSDHCVGNIA